MLPAHRGIDALAAELARFDPELPIERAAMPPSSWYVDPAFFALEQRAVLWRSWQPVARADTLARGGYISGCCAGMPWVVLRGDDDELRGFHNACAHKGREVVTGAGDLASRSVGGASERRLVCGYHAWAYRTDGSLASAPRMAGVEGFDRDAMGLRPLAVEQWGPWIFINGDAEAPSLRARVGALDAELEAGGWRELQYVHSVRWTIACNWKVYVDNYLDGGYHIPHMHPSLADQIDMSTYRTELFDGYSVQTSAAGEGGAQRIGGGAIYAWLYPTFMLNRYGPCLDSNHVVPLDAGRCEVVYDFFFDAAEGDAARRFVEQSIEQAAVTQREDIEICESVQVGLGSPAYDRGRYAPRVEHGELHFHRMLAEDLRRGLQEQQGPDARE